jgi:dTDP-4-dehydrorhamnose 3,5-epimerase-like enzyme
MFFINVADILMVWDLLNTFCLLFKFRKSSMTFEEFSDVILKDENLTVIIIFKDFIYKLTHFLIYYYYKN